MKLLIVALVVITGCGKGDEPSLHMTNSSAKCKQAMACCEQRVKTDKGKVTADDLNLMCSGVALAKTDEECDQFRAGYVAAFESKSVPVPAACK